MSIHLEPDTEKRIHDCMRQCGYPTADEAVRAAIELLESRERDRRRDLDQVRQKIAAGLEQLDRGEGLDGEKVFEELLAELEPGLRT